MDFVTPLLQDLGYALAAQIEGSCMMRREEIRQNKNFHMRVMYESSLLARATSPSAL